MIRLAVRVAPERAELVLAELTVLAPGGLEERDLGDVVEYAIYGAPGELPDVGEVRATVGHALVDVLTTEVPDDWDERWRQWHRPLDVGPLRVRPPWEEPRAGALDIVIEPGQAFGTGAHPSTRLTLGLLLDVPADGPLADWGSGSGVLAVAAARLGFAPVLACDNDPAAVAATLAAAQANGLDAVAAPAHGIAADPPAGTGLIAGRCDLRRAPGPWAPTVTANLVRPLLLDVATRLERPPERLIASGLTTDEVDEVAAAFGRHRLRIASRRDGDGWSAILLAR